MDITTNQTVIEIQPQPITTIELITNPVEIKGDDGRSAYQVAVDNGFVGSEQDWLDSFQNRANHIGTQPISTIENLQDELDSKANISDIGVTIQPYDANLVTYTQTEKDKLANIHAGAEVNVNADWNATSGDEVILNKPNLGTIASRNSDEFATAEQGAKADSAVQPDQIANFETTTQLNARDTANRDRSNHTGTQAISTISGLQTALDSKQPTGDYATNTALNDGLATKEPNIITGTTGQYWRGDKTWQTLDKSAVGLSNVDNTSDLNKPISTATQTALDGKQPLGNYATATQGAKADTALQVQQESIVLLLTNPNANIELVAILAINAFPYNLTINSIRADVATAPTGANLIVDMLKNNTSMMTNKFIIEANETSTMTATILPTLSTNTLASGDKLSFNVEQVGATNKGQYLTVTINGVRG